MSGTPTPYKPSPLSFNSPRTSPFRRPNSPLVPSPSTVRATTPTSSPLKPSTPSGLSPEKTTSTPLRHTTNNPPPAWLSTRGTTTTPDLPTSPTRPQITNSSTAPTLRPTNPTPSRVPATTNTIIPATTTTSRINRPAPTHTTSGDPLTQIPPALLHSMRESFSVLDAHNTGTITPSDLATMLSQLGLDSTPSSLSPYFPPTSGSSTPSINLATYLNTLARLLAPLSHASELSAAFAAFDDDDSGQIDLGELKDALMHTAPEAGGRGLSEREIDMVVEGFSGRRAFGKGRGGQGLGNRGEVFRYGEFVANLTGGGAVGEGGAKIEG